MHNLKVCAPQCCITTLWKPSLSLSPLKAREGQPSLPQTSNWPRLVTWASLGQTRACGFCSHANVGGGFCWPCKCWRWMTFLGEGCGSPQGWRLLIARKEWGGTICIFVVGDSRLGFWAKAGKVDGRALSGHAAKTGAKTQGKERFLVPLCFCLAFERPSKWGGGDCSKEILSSAPEGAAVV